MVDVVVAEIFIAIRLPVLINIVLNDVAITSPIFVNPISLPMKSESTVNEEMYPSLELIELNEPTTAETVLVVSLLM